MDGSRGLIDLELSDAHGRKGLLADIHCVWHGNMNADTQDRTGDNCARSAAAISTPDDSLLRTRTDQRAQRAAAGRARARTRARSHSPCKTAGETIHTFFHGIRSKPHREKPMPLHAMVSREQTTPQQLRLTPEQKVF